MPELTKSQKIIFSLLIVAVLYAFYDLLLAPKKSKDIRTATEVETRQSMKDLLALATTLSSQAAPAKYQHVLNLAQAPWIRNPFVTGPRLNELTGKRTSEVVALKKTRFVYSGYVDMGNQKMAIINNIEYAVDEPLESGGYILRAVFPDKVVIEDMANRRKLEVPLQE